MPGLAQAHSRCLGRFGSLFQKVHQFHFLHGQMYQVLCIQRLLSTGSGTEGKLVFSIMIVVLADPLGKGIGSVGSNGIKQHRF